MRARGSGGVRDVMRKDGTKLYEAVLDVPTTGADGSKSRYQRTKRCRTKREAQALLTAWKAEIAQGAIHDRSKQTVGQLLEYWLENCARHQVSASTLEGYTNTVRKHLLLGLGGMQLQKLTPADLQTFYTQKVDAGCGVRTIELCHLNLSQALDEAVKLGWAVRNVADVVKPPRRKAREMETWDTEEARRFLGVAGESAYGPIWMLALATGMRKGELLGLRWQDVDLEGGVVRVRQTVGKLKGKAEIKPRPKSEKSRRDINVTRDVVDLLRAHKLHQLERRVALGPLWIDYDLVFTNVTGGPIHPDNTDRDFNRLILKAGVKRIRIHDCRHSYATIAGRLGLSIKAISESLGHADVATTLRIYTHVSMEQRAELAEKVGAALGLGGNAGAM